MMMTMLQILLLVVVVVVVIVVTSSSSSSSSSTTIIDIITIITIGTTIIPSAGSRGRVSGPGPHELRPGRLAEYLEPAYIYIYIYIYIYSFPHQGLHCRLRSTRCACAYPRFSAMVVARCSRTLKVCEVTCETSSEGAKRQRQPRLLLMYKSFCRPLCSCPDPKWSACCGCWLPRIHACKQKKAVRKNTYYNLGSRYIYIYTYACIYIYIYIYICMYIYIYIYILFIHA